MARIVLTVVSLYLARKHFARNGEGIKHLGRGCLGQHWYSNRLTNLVNVCKLISMADSVNEELDVKSHCFACLRETAEEMALCLVCLQLYCEACCRQKDRTIWCACDLLRK